MTVMNRDYTGKNVYVGMDVHKKSYVIAAYCDGEFVKKNGRLRPILIQPQSN